MSKANRFRLQRVLDLREQAQQARAVALAQAEQVADAARRERDALEAARDAQSIASECAGGRPVSVGMLRHAQFVLDTLDVRIAGAQSGVVTAESLVKRAQDELHEAYKARRALELLKEKHVAAVQHGERTADQALMDGIALTRFHQQGDARPATPEPDVHG